METGHQLLRRQDLSSPSSLREVAQQILNQGKLHGVLECTDRARFLIVCDKAIDPEIMNYCTEEFYRNYHFQMGKKAHNGN